jgi:PHD/YefM family antitoxin component YafN of YafNO toxin-antitoxin module
MNSVQLSEDIRPVSWLRANTPKALEQIEATRRPLIVTTNGEARAVLQDVESWQAMQEAFAAVRLVENSRASLALKGGRPHAEVAARAKAKLASLLKK